MIDWAHRECPGVDVDRETARFRDHTFARAISDWPGAWRNWMRRALDDLQTRGLQRRGGVVRPLGERGAKNAEAKRLAFGTQEVLDAQG